ncbi:MAG: hypothetical protein AAFO29_12270 [Actinomycetota bacterium]
MASAQLQLINTERPWKLDRRTVEIGRAGLAQARAALEAAKTGTTADPAEVSLFEALPTVDRRQRHPHQAAA